MIHAYPDLASRRTKQLINSLEEEISTMAGRVAKFFSDHSLDDFGKVNNLGDVEFEFLEDEGMSFLDGRRGVGKSHGCGFEEMIDEEDEEREGDDEAVEVEDKKFWEKQHHALQGTLCRTSSFESRVRHAAKETLREMQASKTVCACGTTIASSCCSKCLMREVSCRLRNAGFDSAICRTKWRNSPNIPTGEHSFIDVIDHSSSKKGQERIIIELNFRAEFEMAKTNENYNRLVRRLPEVFVGKVERLQPVIKILCLAAKKCMKEKKMHMGPWRKQRYMQAKWLSACERNTSTPVLTVTNTTDRLAKPKASMLTVDLVGKLPDVHCTAVAVV